MASQVLPIHHSGVPSERGACLFAELPPDTNIKGDRIVVTDRNYGEYTWNGTSWQVPATSASAGAPAAFTSRTLVALDDGAVLVAATAQTATVNTGLPGGFGCTFSGPVSFAGTATVTDKRTSGDADPTCSLVQVAPNAYKAMGTKV